MKLSTKAGLLLLAIDHLGGGAIEEQQLLRRAQISHGSLSAARRELAEQGAVILEREGRKAAYRLTERAGKWLQNNFPLRRTKGTKATINPTTPDTSSPTPPADRQPSDLDRQNTAQAKMTAKKPAAELASMKQSSLPRVTGTFDDRDDWENTLIERIDGCIDISEENDGLYRVYSSDLDEETVYHVTEDEDGFHVR